MALSLPYQLSSEANLSSANGVQEAVCVRINPFGLERAKGTRAMIEVLRYTFFRRIFFSE